MAEKRACHMQDKYKTTASYMQTMCKLEVGDTRRYFLMMSRSPCCKQICGSYAFFKGGGGVWVKTLYIVQSGIVPHDGSGKWSPKEGCWYVGDRGWSFQKSGPTPSSPNFSQQIRGAKIALPAIKEALTTWLVYLPIYCRLQNVGVQNIFFPWLRRKERKRHVNPIIR